MAREKPPADIAALSFEDALLELERTVQALEKGDGPLNAAISAYERGVALKKHCEARLKEAETRIARIVETPAGVTTEEMT